MQNEIQETIREKEEIAQQSYEKDIKIKNLMKTNLEL
jgi:hypothetical protein